MSGPDGQRRKLAPGFYPVHKGAYWDLVEAHGYEATSLLVALATMPHATLDALSVRSLARELGLDRKKVTRLLDDLESAGLIVRQRGTNQSNTAISPDPDALIRYADGGPSEDHRSRGDTSGGPFGHHRSRGDETDSDSHGSMAPGGPMPAPPRTSTAPPEQGQRAQEPRTKNSLPSSDVFNSAPDEQSGRGASPAAPASDDRPAAVRIDLEQLKEHAACAINDFWSNNGRGPAGPGAQAKARADVNDLDTWIENLVLENPEGTFAWCRDRIVQKVTGQE